MSHVTPLKARHEYWNESAPRPNLLRSLDSGRTVAEPTIPTRVLRKFPQIAEAHALAISQDSATKRRPDSLPTDTEWEKLATRTNTLRTQRLHQQAKRTRSVVWLASEDPDKVLENDPFLKERGAPHGYCKKNAPARRYKRSRKGFVTELPPPPSLIDRATVPSRESADVTFLLKRAGKALDTLATQNADDPRLAWCINRLRSANDLWRDGHFDRARSDADDVIHVAEGQQRGGSTYDPPKRNEAPITVTFVR